MKKINSDNSTTAIGVALAAVIAANVDYGLALAGDRSEIGKLIAVLLVAVHSWLTNKK